MKKPVGEWVDGHIALFDAMRGLARGTRISSVGSPDHVPPVREFFSG